VILLPPPLGAEQPFDDRSVGVEALPTAPNYGPFPPATGVPSRSCPIVASYGAEDRLLPGAAAKLENALSASGVVRDIKEYQGVGHSFMNEWKTPSALHIVERIAGVHHSTPQAEDA